ncbi:actin-histidine N-methyltransferase-like [Mytilus edulis]|uniref:actin-histidine N-methyltransferase-like n=1 Tax=Mytilus edulis TaxID=6550 RepID=UPI0039F042C2
MGKKSKKNKEKPAASPEHKELSKGEKKEVLDTVNQLLEVCSNPVNAAGPKELEEYMKIKALVEKVINLQSGLSTPAIDREKNFPGFIEWLHSNGVETSVVDIKNFPGCGYGLQATKDLKEADPFLTIPRKVMMTTQTARDSVLGPLIGQDKMLQAMPSILLALHLLCEKKIPESFWKPYIDVLPDSYCTPLYFTEDEIKLLKGSPVQSDCYNQLKNIARQYAYFYRLFQNLPTTSKLPIKDCFTFEDYRWAVSTVMTRQNQIPTPDGSKITFGLIPMWDMCNHCNGTITTDYNMESDCSDCFALKEFKQGDQISIFYGARSNAELLVHNGFVYPENDMDRTAIKLGISKSDSLIDKKTKLLTALGLAPSRMFFIYSGEIPVDPHLVSFLRVFNMTEDEISCYDCENMTEEDLEKMGDVNTPINVENEEKLWKFLETRLALLLRAYDTTAEEDENLLKEAGITDNKLFIIQLRRCEKIILQNAVKFATEKKCDIVQNSKDSTQTESKEIDVES